MDVVLIGIVLSVLVFWYFRQKQETGVVTANAAKTPSHLLPQDSVLRRHYLTHLRHMIEEVTFPCPSDSVLRRHYEQLIESELHDCLNSEERMHKLIGRYEACRAAA